MKKTGARRLELVLLAVGMSLLALYLASRLYSVVASRAALREFAAISGQTPMDGVDLPAGREHVDFSLWSEKRRAAYEESLAVHFDGPIAVLRIPQLSLEVPVFDGTDELVLNRGVGRIIGTGRPGQAGNVGIAGHRDGFFRCLKDIQVGAQIELATPSRNISYAVDEMTIVEQDDVSVLRPRTRPALTLVTCYPFYFVGNAPKRYIVHAHITESNFPSGNKETIREVKTTNQQEVTK